MLAVILMVLTTLTMARNIRQDVDSDVLLDENRFNSRALMEHLYEKRTNVQVTPDFNHDTNLVSFLVA
jgi:hypothetical protein